MKKKLKKLICIGLACIITLSMAACSPKNEREPLVLADIGWDSIRFHNAVAGHIIKEVYGLEWEETSSSTPIGWQALQSGEIDILMETWSENISYYNEDISKGAVLEVSINFDDNAQGLYVPYYVIHGDSARGIAPMAPDLKTVKDLLNYPELFKDAEEPAKGRIYGAIPGWEIDDIMRNKHEAYGLDEKFTYFSPGTDAALAASIAAAFEKGEAWVGYYWEPTWISGKYKLVLLEDEPYDEAKYADGLTECPTNTVTICVTPSLKEDYPEIYEFLSKYQTSSELIAQALAYMQETNCDYPTAAKWFISNNLDLVSGFIPADKVKDLSSSLA